MFFLNKKLFRTIKTEKKERVKVLFSGPRELGNKVEEVSDKNGFQYSRQYL